MRKLNEILDKAGREQSRVIHEDLLTAIEPESVFAEQFRRIRAELYRAQDNLRTILVTSTTQGEGKTLISANLATMISRDLNRYSLLVEADLRHPVLSRYFGVRDEKGLTDYLSGSARIDQIFVKTGQDKLTLIPGGEPLPNSGELISSKQMIDLIGEIKSRYPDRYIIFDSPPLLETSDPLLLSSLVDTILVVIRAGVTPRGIVRKAIDTLPQEKILGIILNDLQFRTKGMLKRYFGSYNHYYGKHDSKYELKNRNIFDWET